VIYDRMHTREIAAYGGLVNRMPAYALIFMFFTMANVGLPGTSGFIGEFLTLVGTFHANTWAAAVATSGELIREALRTITDLTPREKLIFAPLVAMTLLLGVYPGLVTDITGPSVEKLVADYHEAVGAAAGAEPGAQAGAAAEH